MHMTGRAVGTRAKAHSKHPAKGGRQRSLDHERGATPPAGRKPSDPAEDTAETNGEDFGILLSPLTSRGMSQLRGSSDMKELRSQ